MENHRLISIKEVCRRTSLSRTTISKKRDNGMFPLPVILGECRIAFVAAEIDQWIKERMVERAKNNAG